MMGTRRGDTRTYFRRGQFEPLMSTLMEDPVLSDVPKNATLRNIDTLRAMELGSAMKLSILKLDGTSFGTKQTQKIHPLLINIIMIMIILILLMVITTILL
jgi:hypothetical protein